MGWRFRKSFRVMPGVRINISKSGLSTSIGAAPFTMNIGPRGAFVTGSVPGTGISVRQRVGASVHGGTPQPLLPSGNGAAGALPREPAAIPTLPDIDPATEIRSASTESLTSTGLTEFRRALAEAERERSEIEREVSGARNALRTAKSAYESWRDGFFWRRVQSAKFGARQTAFEEAKARLEELEEQLRLTVLATHIEVPSDIAEPYHRMRDAFARLAGAQKIWDVLASRATDRVTERTAADAQITREPVVFAMGTATLIQSEWRVPHLQNRNGGDLYLYPGFVLYRVSNEAFAVIDAREVAVTYTPTNFHEHETIPADAKVVGHTWAKVNKDGSPDRRFRDNYQIPLVRYAEIEVVSSSGLREVYLVSDDEAARRFTEAWGSVIQTQTHQ